MTDARDNTINTLNSKLSIALRLMTLYQRKRYRKITDKMYRERACKSLKTGRPREFKGHVPVDRATAGQEGTVQSIRDRRADVG